jgi:hypothetical protein
VVNPVRRIAVALIAVAMLAPTGCGVRMHNDPAGTACASGDRWVLADVEARRLGRDEDPRLDTRITVSARSSAANFGGVDATTLGSGISGINPVVVERLTPFHPSLCWDPQYPVSLRFRVTLIMANDIQAGDTIYCVLEDGSTDGRGHEIDQQQRTVEVVDMIPGAPDVQVECQDFYIPPGWTGLLPDRPERLT